MTMKCSSCRKEVDVLIWQNYPLSNEGGAIALSFCPGCWGNDRDATIEFSDFLKDRFELGL